MVTVTCSTAECVNAGLAYNVLGDPTFVECGGCHAHLEPTDRRDDPPAPEPPPYA